MSRKTVNRVMTQQKNGCQGGALVPALLFLSALIRKAAVSYTYRCNVRKLFSIWLLK